MYDLPLNLNLQGVREYPTWRHFGVYELILQIGRRVDDDVKTNEGFRHADNAVQSSRLATVFLS